MNFAWIHCILSYRVAAIDEPDRVARISKIFHWFSRSIYMLIDLCKNISDFYFISISVIISVSEHFNPNDSLHGDPEDDLSKRVSVVS